MGSKTETWAGTKMQRAILLKRPTFLLYDGVESLPCAILSTVHKLQFPGSIKSSFQDKRNKTVAVLIFTMNKGYCDAPTILVLYRKGHSPPVLWVPDLGGERATPHYCRMQGQQGNSLECTGRISHSHEAITQLGSLRRHCPKAANDSPSKHRTALHSVP